MRTPSPVNIGAYPPPPNRGLRKADHEIMAAMNRNFIGVEPDSDVFNAIRMMNENNIGNVPVTDEGEMTGLISRRDIVDALSWEDSDED